MEHGDMPRLFGALVALVLLAGACGDDEPPREEAAAPTAGVAPAPTYDGTLEPAAAVLALVPRDAQALTVTDFDAVRAELGAEQLTDESAPAEVAAFWQRASAERPLLTTGMLRTSRQDAPPAPGITELDVAWEAHFTGPDGQETGWVLRFRDGTDMSRVAQAAQDPQGPLHGGTVDAADMLVTSGTTDDPEQSWAAEPELTALVTLPANATYVARSCVPAAAGAEPDELDELTAWSVQLQGSLATAWLGPGRQDLFTRMRLAEADPAFAAAYDGGVADPVTGRIGYVMTDPAAAARLALDQRLPFATCS